MSKGRNLFIVCRNKNGYSDRIAVLVFAIKKSDEYHKKIKAGCEILEAKIAADKNTIKKSGVYDSRIDELQNKRNELFQIINH